MFLFSLNHLQIFVCGFGDSAGNKHLLSVLAMRGAGALQMYDSSKLSQWRQPTEQLLAQTREATLTDIRLEWILGDNCKAPEAMLQVAPKC